MSMKLFGLPLFLFFFLAQVLAPIGVSNSGPTKHNFYSQLTNVSDHSPFVDETDSNLQKTEMVTPKTVSPFQYEISEKTEILLTSHTPSTLRHFTLIYISRFITSPPLAFLS